MEKNQSSQANRETAQTLPPVHIMAGGLHSLPHTRFAAECLWHKCPEVLRPQLKIQIGMFAIPKHLTREAESFVCTHPCVSVLLNPVRVPLKIFNLSPGYARIHIARTLELVRTALDRLGLPPKVQVKLCPLLPERLRYYQEYYVRICDLESHRERICIMDADYFVWDKRFFEELQTRPAEDVFASSYLQRSQDGATLDGHTCYPAGSECVRLNPALFNRWNRQTDCYKTTIQKRMQARYPGIKFQRPVIDTIYQACWEAQFSGMKIDYPFCNLQVCHVGGFGHSNVSYIEECLLHPMDENNRAPFWVQRIRLNQRVATELEARFPQPWVGVGLAHVQKRAEAAWAVPEIRQLRDKTPPSNDEELFEKIVSGMGR